MCKYGIGVCEIISINGSMECCIISKIAKNPAFVGRGLPAEPDSVFMCKEKWLSSRWEEYLWQAVQVKI